MAAHQWRKVISRVVNACIEGSLALDPGAYAAFYEATALDEREPATVGVHRTANRVGAHGGRPAATAVYIASGS